MDFSIDVYEYTLKCILRKELNEKWIKIVGAYS
jgi:hypothetical protein